jgi:aminoglycoside N3'-acetyltransferase
MKKYIDALLGETLIHNSSHVVVHSDIIKLYYLEHRNYSSPDSFLKECSSIFKSIFGEQIWFPTFNYEFPKKKMFDVIKDKSQIGILNNYILSDSNWRSETPIFNFCGYNSLPFGNDLSVFYPFRSGFEFDKLYIKNSLYLHFGSKFSNTTLIHYVEEMSNKLFYRYEKCFPGKLKNISNEIRDVKLIFNVRPLNYYLEYDWDKMYNELFENGIISKLTINSFEILMFQTVPFVEFILSKLNEDPFYMIDSETKKWVIPKIDKLGRKFRLTDFE